MSRAKKRKVSMEPVLQDFTVTSFSDLNPDVPGPSDSSLFEEIKNYDVGMAETTFNNTSEINLSSGPFPSDSSLNSFFKQLSNSGKNSKVQRPFQKLSRKKSVKGNLFDSCLENTFSDSSPAKVHRPFLRKKKNNVRLSMFDSDLESTPTNDSSFKKPFQQKSKNKQKLNLFDSLLKDSQPNTPVEQLSRPFQRKSKKKISSNYFDGVLSSESINQSSPAQNFITRRISRMKKRGETSGNNVFDEDFSSSQSDVSIPVQPMILKHRTGSNHIKKSSGMFDDIIDNTGNESQDEKSSLLHPCNKSNDLNEDHGKSFNLEFNEETGDNSDGKCSSENEETVDEETDQHEINKEENKPSTDLPDQQGTTGGDEMIKPEGSCDNKRSYQRDLLEDEEKELEINGEKSKYITELPNQHDPIEDVRISIDKVPIEPKTKNQETRRSDENEKLIEDISQLPDSIYTPESDNSTYEKTKECEEIETMESIENKGENEAVYEFSDQQGDDTLENEKTDESENDEESECTLKIPDESDSSEHEEVKETKVNNVKNKYIVRSISHKSSITDTTINGQEGDETLKEDDSTKDLEESENKSQSDDSVVVAINEVVLVESINASPNSRRSSLHSAGIMPIEKLNYDSELCSLKIINTEMSISTPGTSFKDMPSSTPYVKDKRVSFFLGNDVSKSTNEDHVDTINGNQNGSTSTKSDYVQNVQENHDGKLIVHKDRLDVKKGIKSNVEDNKNCNETSIHRKSSLRTHKRNNDQVIVNNSTLDTSMYLRKRRVSFKIEDRGSGTSKWSNVENSVKLNQSKGNQSNTNNFSTSLEPLVLEEPSENITPDSESVYIDMHPSTYKSTSGSNAKSLSISAKEEESECEEEQSEVEEEESGVEENEPGIEEEESEGDEEESKCEEEESESEEKEPEVGDEESDIDEEKEGQEENDGQYVSAEEPLESEEEKEGQKRGGESDERNKEKTGYEGFIANNHVISEQDENVNPYIRMPEEFKIPSKAPKKKNKIRTSSLFKEKLLEVPTKSELKDIFNRIPFSELKLRKKQNSNEHCMSREQMQQFEIEEGLLRNRHQKKVQNKNSFSGSNQLKRPKKWVSHKLYDFLINKLKPQYGIRSRVRAEELVLFLVQHVEHIMKTKELMREDVEKMKIELATLGIVKTHWDFFQFVNQYFDYFFKEKMYPSSLGAVHSAFKFGPTNVMEDILKDEINSVDDLL